MFTFAFDIQPVRSEPRTWIVDDDGPADFPTIQEAINNANGGDTVFVRNGTYYENVVVNKSISLVGENKETTIIDGCGARAHAIFIRYIENVRITGFTIQNTSYYCISLVDTAYTNISHNRMKNATYGIGLYSMHDVVIGNEIDATWIGAVIEGDQGNITMVGNKFTNCGLAIGSWASGNTIEDNTVNGKPLVYFENMSGYDVKDAGQVILVCCDNIKVENSSLSNTTIGLQLWGTNNSKILGNSVLNNYIGFAFSYSYNNTFHHNNLSNNTWLICDLPGIPNSWDNGYPSGGNYWSDYEARYPNASEIDDSGIWDTPYAIDENNQDNYPLMNPWTPVPPSINASVDIIPNTLNLKTKPKYVTAFIELPEDYNVSDIDISSILMNNTISVSPEAQIVIGDYDNDTIPDLMVKFNGTEVIEYILDNINMTELAERRRIDVTLTVAGRLNDGTIFQGSDIVRVMMPRGRGKHFLVPM